MIRHELKQAIFNISSNEEFKAIAFEIFKLQFEKNKIYNLYCTHLKKTPSQVHTLDEIPFIPIQFFKKHKISSCSSPTQIIFTSSGTSGNETSKHHVTDLSLYEKSFSLAFEKQFPNYKEASIIALLPSYLEREGSSLIYMCHDLINKSKGLHKGFYKTINQDITDFFTDSKKPKILIGVSYALCELAEKNIPLQNTIVIETGGMKGMRKELIREELHELLKKGLGVEKIHSEYGMTELLSQAYYTENTFNCPPWMKILKRDVTDPLSTSLTGKGALNVIDLANIDSCSFIATDDLGEVYPNGSFDVKGRIDHSQIRGCNLLV